MMIRKGCIAILGLVCQVWIFEAAIAAEKYALDEQVEVLFLNQWYPAAVRDQNKKGEVLGEFTFANQQRQEVFPPEKVRHLYEAGALARARLWSDLSGKFKVKAALLKVSGGKVELRTEESKVVTIAIEKLSTKDQAFVKQFQQQAGLAAIPVPDLPAVSEFDTSRSVRVTGKGRQSDRHEPAATEKVQLRLQADPVRKGLQLKQAGLGFPSQGSGEKLSSLIALGGADNWVLASIGENAEQPTRLMWLALAKQSVKRIQMLPAGEMLMDYHAASKQMLTYSKRKSGPGAFDLTPVLTVWQTDPSIEEPRAVVSFSASLRDDQSWHHSVPWVRFASDSHIVQRTETHRIFAWDVKQRRLSWDTAQESFFAPEPRLSAGGKYLLLPEDAGLRIMDTVTGATLGEIPMNGCSGVSAHPGGSLIAVANQNHVYVVDLTGAQPTRSVEAASVGSPFAMKFEWVGDKFLCLEQSPGSGGMVLFGLDLGLPIWTYTFDPQAYWATTGNGARARSIVDDHLVYAATFDARGSHGLAVGAVELPGAKAQAAIAGVKRDDFMAIKPGSRFRIEVTALDHASEIRQALQKQITANGWIYDESASNVITAEYKRGETQQVRYEMQSLTAGQRQVQTASITPYLAALKVKLGNEIAWETMSSSGPPPVVVLKDTDSLQSEVDRGNSPNWSFYESVDIPSEIVDPKKRGGIGQTSVTNRGLVEQQLGQ